MPRCTVHSASPGFQMSAARSSVRHSLQRQFWQSWDP
jgi:hypothetical protein